MQLPSNNIEPNAISNSFVFSQNGKPGNGRVPRASSVALPQGPSFSFHPSAPPSSLSDLSLSFLFFCLSPLSHKMDAAAPSIAWCQADRRCFYISQVRMVVRDNPKTTPGVLRSQIQTLGFIKTRVYFSSLPHGDSLHVPSLQVLANRAAIIV